MCSRGDDYGYFTIEYDLEVSHKIRDNPKFKEFIADLGKRTAETIIKESFKYQFPFYWFMYPEEGLVVPNSNVKQVFGCMTYPSRVSNSNVSLFQRGQTYIISVWEKEI